MRIAIRYIVSGWKKKNWIRHVASIIICEFIRDISQEHYFEVLIYDDWLLQSG
jgi:hypothetical protein